MSGKGAQIEGENDVVSEKIQTDLVVKYHKSTQLPENEHKWRTIMKHMWEFISGQPHPSPPTTEGIAEEQAEAAAAAATVEEAKEFKKLFGETMLAAALYLDEATNSGTSATYPKQCSTLRKDEYVMLKGRPCRIVEISTFKTVAGLDIFTGEKCEESCPVTHNMDIPRMELKEYLLVGILDDGHLTLKDPSGQDIREDLKIPEGDKGEQLKSAYETGRDILCTVLKSCGEEGVIDFEFTDEDDK